MDLGGSVLPVRIAAACRKLEVWSLMSRRVQTLKVDATVDLQYNLTFKPSRSKS